MIISRLSSLLLVIDMQERLLPVIEDSAQAVNEIAWLGSLGRYLEVPIWLTEQYPQGLGSTDKRLHDALDARSWQKTHFNAYEAPGFAQTLAASGRQQIILCGAEAHICVLQTALGLLDAGYRVFWLAEATVSRRPDEAILARRRAEAAGAITVTADMVAYEWLERCDTPQFKQAHQQWLKERASRTLRLM